MNKKVRQTKILAIGASETEIPLIYVKTLEDNIEREIEKKKKIELHLVCPLCGQHKKMMKYNPQGSGSRIREIKEERINYVCQKDETLCKKLSKEPQEYFKKYHDEDKLRKTIYQLKQKVKELFNLEINEEAIISFLFNEEKFRQPTFNDGENLPKQKLLSIRINYGNPYAGKFKQMLGSFKILKELNKVIWKKYAQNVINKFLSELPEEKKMEILQQICAEIKINEKEEPIEDILKELKENNTGKGEDEFPSFFGYEGISNEDIEELKKLVMEEIKDKDFKKFAIHKLLPKTQQLENPIGFKEVEEISIEEFIELLKFLKGSELKKIQALLKLANNLIGIESNVEYESLMLCIIVSYLYIQLEKILIFSKTIANYLENNLY